MLPQGEGFDRRSIVGRLLGRLLADRLINNLLSSPQPNHHKKMNGASNTSIMLAP